MVFKFDGLALLEEEIHDIMEESTAFVVVANEKSYYYKLRGFLVVPVS